MSEVVLLCDDHALRGSREGMKGEASILSLAFLEAVLSKKEKRLPALSLFSSAIRTIKLKN